MITSTAITAALELFPLETTLHSNARAFIAGKRTKAAARAFLGLSTNNKMPCYTLSLSERASCPRGGKLAEIEGTICFNCYAAKGADAWTPAQSAKARRFALMRLASVNYAIRQLVREAFRVALKGEGYFRFHSAGDLFSDNYAEMVSEIIADNPCTRFWIPTREAKRARILQKHSNAAVRVSDDMVNQRTNKYNGLTSGAHSAPEYNRGLECQAMANEGACGDCRACWSHDVAHVSYKLH